MTTDLKKNKFIESICSKVGILINCMIKNKSKQKNIIIAKSERLLLRPKTSIIKTPNTNKHEKINNIRLLSSFRLSNVKCIRLAPILNFQILINQYLPLFSNTFNTKALQSF